MPKLSVIVPVYNAENYLKRCVESILIQTFYDFELILVDDGSTDRSGIICDNLKKEDNRIIVIHKKNEGVSAARNAGIDIATGECIMFIDSDDYIDNKMFKTMLDHSDADFIISGLRFVDISQKKIKECKEKDFFCVKMNDFMQQYYINMDKNLILSGPYNKLYKKEIIESAYLRFNVNISICEDGLFVAKYLDRCKSVSNISHCYYNYVQYDLNNLMQKYNDNAIDASAMLFDAKKNLVQKNDKNNQLLYYVELTSLNLMYSFFTQIYSRSGLNSKYKYQASAKALENDNFKRLLAKYKNNDIRFWLLNHASNNKWLWIVHILYSMNFLKIARIIKKIIRKSIRR